MNGLLAAYGGDNLISNQLFNQKNVCLSTDLPLLSTVGI